VAPSKIVMIVPASALPRNVGVRSVVISSEKETPVSDNWSRKIVVSGAARSMVTVRLALFALVFPAASTAFAVNTSEPVISELLVKLQLPLAAAVTVPIELPSRNTCTVEFASAMPVRFKLKALVRLSLDDAPESDDAARSIVGAAGGVVSTWTRMEALRELGLPATSVACAVRL
jgi:hypothetical protein